MEFRNVVEKIESEALERMVREAGCGNRGTEERVFFEQSMETFEYMI